MHDNAGDHGQGRHTKGLPSLRGLLPSRMDSAGCTVPSNGAAAERAVRSADGAASPAASCFTRAGAAYSASAQGLGALSIASALDAWSTASVSGALSTARRLDGEAAPLAFAWPPPPSVGGSERLAGVAAGSALTDCVGGGAAAGAAAVGAGGRASVAAPVRDRKSRCAERSVAVAAGTAVRNRNAPSVGYERIHPTSSTPDSSVSAFSWNRVKILQWPYAVAIRCSGGRRADAVRDRSATRRRLGQDGKSADTKGSPGRVRLSAHYADKIPVTRRGQRRLRVQLAARKGPSQRCVAMLSHVAR